MTNPRFTRRDFQFLADWLREDTPTLAVAKRGTDPLMLSLANRLEKTNPNFNRARFIAAATK